LALAELDAKKAKGWIRLSLRQHVARICLLMTAALVFLGWLAAHTDVMFADGLRYIALARTIDQGSFKAVLTHSVDHPVYSAAIVVAHHLLGGNQPQDWQAAGQFAAVLSGVLLVIPLYLFALELCGAPSAWLACLFTFLVPLTGHVVADVLSESTFLLFWTAGCWTALRFLRQGRTIWLLPTAAFAGLAYLTRPEGLLLPVALGGTLLLMPIVPSTRIGWPHWRRAVGFLFLGSVLLVGPYVALKGGIGTKPAVARLLGLTPRSPAMAVERERPLDTGQSVRVTYGIACRAVMRAVLVAVPPPLFLLATAGLFAPGRAPNRRRKTIFLALIIGGWTLALVRLHATGGYCTPRHAMILSLPMLASAARGLTWVIEGTVGRFFNALPVAWVFRVQTAALGICVLCCLAFWKQDLLAPINQGFRGYRLAGEWIAAHTPADAHVVDLKGWATFYGERTGYSFGELDQARQDPKLGWLVAHDALLIGPWDYCEFLRTTLNGRSPVRSFPESRKPGIAQVHVFDLAQKLARRDNEAIAPARIK
jgi:hypothetical protein